MKHKDKVKTNPYCLDKLALTLSVDDTYHERIKKRLRRLMRGKSQFTKKTGIGVHCAPNASSGLKELYSENFQLKLGIGFSQTSLSISICPKRRRMNFLRIEFNPNRAKKSGLRNIREFLVYFCGQEATAKLYSNCKVTRADTCIDGQIDMGNTFPYVPCMRRSQIFRDSDGVIETYIMKSTLRRFLVYDNEAEYKHRTGEEGNFSKPSFRLELQTRKLGNSLQELHPKTFFAAMTKVEFYSDDFLEDEYFSSSFLQRAEEFGLNSALFELDKSTRKSYRRRLRSHHCVECPFDLSEITEKDFRKVLKIFKFKNNR